MNLIFDIETDDLDATRIWCIVAKEIDGKAFRKGRRMYDKDVKKSPDGNTIRSNKCCIMSITAAQFSLKGQTQNVLDLSQKAGPVTGQ